jgi:hypothetical protein
MMAQPRPGSASGRPQALSRKLIDELVGAAVAAPSMHNTQPWRFRIGPAKDTIELFADPARILPVEDPQGRAAHIACGAALFNLRVAAAVAGLQPAVSVLPDPAQPLLLAQIRLTGPHRATSRERALYATIPRRQTNREPFSNRPVPAGVRAELAEAASVEAAILHFLDHDETLRVRSLAAESERDLFADPAYRAELARWAGGPRDHDGIPGRALGPRSPEGGEPVRDLAPEPGSAPARYAWFEEEPQLAVLSVRSGGARGWLAAGQALERVWLTATWRGVSVSPLTQSLETRDAWLVRDPQSEPEQPQMILRIGYGLPLPPGAPRRPVADVLEIVDAPEG